MDNILRYYYNSTSTDPTRIQASGNLAADLQLAESDRDSKDEMADIALHNSATYDMLFQARQAVPDADELRGTLTPAGASPVGPLSYYNPTAVGEMNLPNWALIELALIISRLQLAHAAADDRIQFPEFEKFLDLGKPFQPSYTATPSCWQRHAVDL